MQQLMMHNKCPCFLLNTLKLTCYDVHCLQKDMADVSCCYVLVEVSENVVVMGLMSFDPRDIPTTTWKQWSMSYFVLIPL